MIEHYEHEGVHMYESKTNGFAYESWGYLLADRDLYRITTTEKYFTEEMVVVGRRLDEDERMCYMERFRRLVDLVKE